jgi:hypothetical protein
MSAAKKGQTVRLVLMRYESPTPERPKGKYHPIPGFGKSMIAPNDVAVARLWDTVSNASELWKVEQTMEELERKGAIGPSEG